jgi:hypothetical protein
MKQNATPQDNSVMAFGARLRPPVAGRLDALHRNLFKAVLTHATASGDVHLALLRGLQAHRAILSSVGVIARNFFENVVARWTAGVRHTAVESLARIAAIE